MLSIIHQHLCILHKRLPRFAGSCLQSSQQQNTTQRCFQSGLGCWQLGEEAALHLNRAQHSLLSRTSNIRGTFPGTVRSLSVSSTLQKPEMITINYVNRDGSKMSIKGPVGDSLLDVAIDNDLEIEGYGACEGTLACSTCHLIFEGDRYSALPEASDEEQDMLDFACGLTDTSRLGCQITLTKDMDGMTVRVPEGVADARDV